ncbi:septum site-determining protein MinC [Carnobacterium iners]|uniref:Probable septum site-determining protein MinC n=1 Tax=Carnobacterium iners TaxID=1073423 RepID=A0A1X7NMI4_9LACT|nr:septum site-determining protein MinC [Carnobacterium iners]SEK31993.1 septum site-determining protein MinC [Carnobacterium iners]SMH39153.1 septum site-determining protein MinC [Carnobacterium iners]
MKQSVTLKGSKDGFVLTLNESASFATIVGEIEQLLDHLRTESKKGDSNETNKEILLEVATGNRLLTDKEKKKITKIIKENSQFEIKKISSSVLTYKAAIAWQEANSLQMEMHTIRSGQVLQASGDILFVGKVHPGGIIRANGSIFIIGELHGVAHAGSEGDATAVIVADFQTNAQIRIADSIQIIENKITENLAMKNNEFAFINDLHVLAFENLNHLRKIRPTLGKMLGGLI